MKIKSKGFTVVELVIIISAIAILAAILIPTFAGVVKESRRSAALQDVTAAYKDAYRALYGEFGAITEGKEISVNLFEFRFEANGEGVTINTMVGSPYHEKFDFEYVDGTIVVKDFEPKDK